MPITERVDADAVAAYLNAQIEAGAQAVMIFDSWGGVLADGAFQEFSLAYTARVLAQEKKEHNGGRIPSLVFTKGGGLWLTEMNTLNCDVLGLDWTPILAKALGAENQNVGLSLMVSIYLVFWMEFATAIRMNGPDKKFAVQKS